MLGINTTPHPSPEQLNAFQIEHYRNRALNAESEDAKRYALSQLRLIDRRNKSGLTKPGMKILN